MMPILLLMFAFFALALTGRLLEKQKLELFSAAIGLAINGLCLFQWTQKTGQWPVFHLFESLLVLVFLLGAMGLIFPTLQQLRSDVRKWVWLQILLLCVLVCLMPKTIPAQPYAHDYIYSILFHLFRRMSLAFMLFASALYNEARRDGTFGESHRARNHLLLAAVIFLLSEYAGILWCLNGWGDFWMWNQGFFQSTLIILYLMIAFHIPARLHRSDKIRNTIGTMAGFVVLALMLLRGFV